MTPGSTGSIHSCATTPIFQAILCNPGIFNKAESRGDPIQIQTPQGTDLELPKTQFKPKSPTEIANANANLKRCQHIINSMRTSAKSPERRRSRRERTEGVACLDRVQPRAIKLLF
jgi:hypothetical protein